MTVKQSLFAEAVLAGESITAAAQTAGVSGTQAHKWLNAGLRDFITQRRRETFEAGLNRLETNLTQAVITLAELMGGDSPPPQRLGAAKTVVEQTIKLFELRSIEQRITALEQAHAASKGTG